VEENIADIIMYGVDYILHFIIQGLLNFQFPMCLAHVVLK